MADQSAFDEAFGATGFVPNVAEAYKERARKAFEESLTRERKPNPFAPDNLVTREQFWGLEPGAAPAQKKADYNDRTKRWLEKNGYQWERVDHYDARLTRHKDLLGMFDYLAFREGETVGVQVTAKASVSTRRKKILNEPRRKMVQSAGWKILILGFETGSREAPVEIWL